jgi:hypothetical protein
LVITAVAVLAGKVLDGQFTRGRERPSS